jgi:trk system potassium uptake protein TrkA
VLHEEGVGKEDLLLHGVDRAGAFVACAGDDRSNLLAALHAQQLGARLCMAVVARQEFVPLVAAMGIDVAYSPRLATAEAILRFVRGEQVRAMHLLFSGAELLELYVEAESPVDGAEVVGLDIPGGGQVAAVLRGDRVLLPRDGARIDAHDRVLIFGPRGSSSSVERMFNA